MRKFHTDITLNAKTIGFLPKTQAATCTYYSRQEPGRVFPGACEQPLERPEGTEISGPVRTPKDYSQQAPFLCTELPISIQCPVFKQSMSFIKHLREVYKM